MRLFAWSRLAAALSLVTLFATQATASCSIFNIVNQTYTERGATTIERAAVVAAIFHYRVSPGIVCTNSTYNPSDPSPCSGLCQPLLTDGTFISETGSSNVSMTTTELANLFSLVSANLSMPFPMTANATLTNGNVEGASCVAGPWSGFVAYTPNFLCVNGIVDGCGAGDGLANGTSIRLCAPDTNTNGTILDGSIYQAQTSSQIAAGLGPAPVPEVRLYGNYSDPTNGTQSQMTVSNPVPSAPILAAAAASTAITVSTGSATVAASSVTTGTAALMTTTQASSAAPHASSAPAAAAATATAAADPATLKQATRKSLMLSCVIALLEQLL